MTQSNDLMRRPIVCSRAIAVGLAVAILLGGACATEEDRSSSGADITEPRPNPARSDGAGPTNLFDSLAELQKPDDNFRFLFMAQQELVRRCMEARGLKYLVSPPSTAAGQLPYDVLATLMPEAPPLDARRSAGYGLSGTHVRPTTEQQGGDSRVETSGDVTTVEGPGVPAQDRYVQGLSPAERRAYMEAMRGTEQDTQKTSVGPAEVSYPTKGCVADAVRDVYGDLAQHARMNTAPQRLQNLAMQHVFADAAVNAALRPWQRCMAERGFHHESPARARQALKSRYTVEGSSEGLRRTEIEVAVADAECGERSGYYAAVVRARDAHLQAVAPEEQRLILQLVEFRRAAVQRARAVLGG